MYKFSEALAWVAGVMLPVGETLRGWGTWWDVPLAYLGDLFIGALCLFVAWRSRQGDDAGQRWRVASFGVGCGMGDASWAFTMAQLQQVDPSGASGATAAIVKFAMLSLSILGLAGALRERADRRNPA